MTLVLLQKKISASLANRYFYPKKTYLIHNLTYGLFKDTIYLNTIPYPILGVFI